MAEFRVDLEGIELSEDQSRKISAGVQRLVLNEIADLDFGGDSFAVIRNPEWFGIWIRRMQREDFESFDPKVTGRFGRSF